MEASTKRMFHYRASASPLAPHYAPNRENYSHPGAPRHCTGRRALESRTGPSVWIICFCTRPTLIPLVFRIRLPLVGVVITSVVEHLNDA